MRLYTTTSSTHLRQLLVIDRAKNALRGAPRDAITHRRSSHRHHARSSSTTSTGTSLSPPTRLAVDMSCTNITVVIIANNHLHHHRRHHRSWSTSTPNGFFFAKSGLNPRHLLLLQLDRLQQTPSSSITTSPPESEYPFYFVLLATNSSTPKTATDTDRQTENLLCSSNRL